MPAKLYLCGMSLEKEPTVTDALEAIKALREWLEEQIDSGKETLNEQEQKMTEQSTQIMANQGRLDNLETEIKRAEKRYKGLTTMIIFRGQRYKFYLKNEHVSVFFAK